MSFFIFLISQLDLFRSPIIIKFEKNEKNSTYFGFFFSLAIIIFLSVYFFNSDVFLKQLPTIVNIDIANVNRPFISYKDKLFAISITDESSVAFNDDTIFEIKVVNRYLQVSPTNNGFYFVKNVTKSLHLCQPSDFKNNEYNNLGLKGAYCLDNNFFETQGFWDENTLMFLEITIKMCDNKTSKSVCKSSTEIQKFLNGKDFNVYYEGINLDPTNYTSPMNPISYNDYYFIDTKMKKISNVFLKNINLQTDDGLILSNVHEINNILFDSKETDILGGVDNSSDANNIIFQCNFYSSRNSQSMQRIYQKLLDALSNLGGIANIAMIFGYIITSIESSFTLKKKVMNALYSFQDINKYREKVESRKTSKVGINMELKSIENSSPGIKSPKSKSENMFGNWQKEKKTTILEESNSIKKSNNDLFLKPIQEAINTYKKQDIFIETMPKNRNETENSLFHKNETIFDQAKKEDEEFFKSEEPQKIATLTKIQEIDLKNDENISHPGIQEAKNYENISPSGQSYIYHSPNRSPTMKINLKKGKTTKIDKKIKNLEEYEEYLKNSSSKLNVNFFEYMVLYFKLAFKKNLNEKQQLFLKGVQAYEKELDIVQMLKKIQEIEKLKMVLFNDEQRTLFNFIEKPMIYLDEEHKNYESSQLKMSRVINSATILDENKIKKILEHFSALQKKGELSIVDKRLMDLVERKLTEFIQNF